MRIIPCPLLQTPRADSGCAALWLLRNDIAQITSSKVRAAQLAQLAAKVDGAQVRCDGRPGGRLWNHCIMAVRRPIGMRLGGFSSYWSTIPLIRLTRSSWRLWRSI